MTTSSAPGEPLHQTQSTSSSGSHPSHSTSSSHSIPLRSQNHPLPPHSLPSSFAGSSKRPNLPPPPPPDRLPPPKGRSIKDGAGKFKLGKKKSKAPPADVGRSSAAMDDEEWTFEGSSGDPRINGHSHIPTISTSRASVEMPAGADAAMYDSQLTEVPSNSSYKAKDKEKEKKMSKGRGLAKKTSRLFMRDKDKDRDRDRSSERDKERESGVISPGSQSSSLNLPSGSRQTSYSSMASGESYASASTANGSSHRLALHRPMSAASNQRFSTIATAASFHSRRLSQDSHNSWQARSVRSSTST